MLLPSLLSCDGLNRPIAPSQASVVLSREPAICPRPTDILNSCRALQAILGPSSITSANTSRSSNIAPPQRPRLLRTSAQSQYNLHTRTDRVAKKTSPTSSPMKPRTIKRRRADDCLPGHLNHERSLSEASTLASNSPDLKGYTEVQNLPVPSPMFDQENTNLMDLDSATPSGLPSPYSTPKRRRLAPLSLPLGLTVQDYEALNMPPGYGENQSQNHQPESSSSLEEQSSDWTPEDDEALVTLLLDKFRLSKRDWNECARILGRDKDSMGRRWRMLVGDGKVGLRRADLRGSGGNRRIGIEEGFFDGNRGV